MNVHIQNEVLTPIARHSRLRRRRHADNGKSPGSSPIVYNVVATSTPTNARMQPKLNGEGVNKIRHFDLDEEEDDDEGFPPSSQYQPKADGKVYWNGEASPGVKAELQRKLKEADAMSPGHRKTRRKSRHLMEPPVALLKRSTSSTSSTDPQKAMEMIKSLKEFSAFAEGTQQASQINPEKVPKKETTNKDDPFGDSEDDSFLVRCTQAFEEKIEGKKTNESSKLPQVVESNKPIQTVIAEKNNPFEENDDSFDLLMSQLPDQLLKDPAKTKPDTDNFKRFISDGNQLSDLRNDPNRTHSSPSIPNCNPATPLFPGGRALRQGKAETVVVRRTKAEIEKRRLEAIKKREAKKMMELR